MAQTKTTQSRRRKSTLRGFGRLSALSSSSHSASTLKTRESAVSPTASGSDSARSQLDTVWRVTPSFSASCP